MRKNDPVPYSNRTARAVHIGSVIVRPGETRMVDPRLVKGHTPAKPAAAPPPDPNIELLTLLASNTAQITAALPDLSDDQLAALDAAEQAAEKPRKGVVEAIAAERLGRAAGAGA